RSNESIAGPLCGGIVISTPEAGSRPAITSQKLTFVFTPTPSGVGQLISGTIFFSAAAGGAALRAGGFRICAASGTVRIIANTIARIEISVHRGQCIQRDARNL